MTDLYSFMLSVGVTGCCVSMMLFVLFNQTTVRKLKTIKHSEPTNQYHSNWDVINTAQALSIPKSWAEKLEHSTLSALYTNASALHTQTTTADRALAATFYWLLTSSTTTLVLLVFLDAINSITALSNSLVPY